MGAGAYAQVQTRSTWEDSGETRGGIGLYGPSPRGKLTNVLALQHVRRRVNPKLLDAHRFPMEREWIKNIAFLNGNQHFVEVGAGFRAPVLEPHKVMYRANMVRTQITKMVSTVMSNGVTFRAPSKDLSKKSRDQAFVTEKLFEHFREDVVDWSELIEEALTWAACCGTGFIELGWDADAGSPDRFYLDDKGEAVFGLAPDQMLLAEEQGKFQDIPQGEVTGRVRSPFQVQWDWSARQKWKQAAWGATKELVDIEYLEDLYGYAKTKNIKPIEPKSHSMWYDEMLAFMGGLGGLGSTPSYITPKDKARQRVVLVRYWEIPLRHNNYKGRFIVTAGDEVLVNGDNPMVKTGYPIPLLKIDWQKRPGSFMGHAPMEDMRNPQFQYNNARAKQTEVLNVHSHPAMFIDKRAGLPEGTLAITPGLTYQVDTVACGGKPVILGPVPQVPKELAESAHNAKGELDFIGSQADPGSGPGMPGQVRATAGIGMLIDQKNLALMPVAKSVLRATLLGGRMMLAIAKHNYTLQRTVKYVGEDNAYRVLTFSPADIQTDIRIVGEPEYFKTRATAKQEIQEYVQAGILDPINNPEDRELVLKVLAFGNAEEAIAEKLADAENQDREWDEMATDPTKYITTQPTGESMLHYPTQPFDDHAEHLQVMRRRMKTQEFRDLDPVAKQLVTQHYEEHSQILQQQQMQQMMMAQAAQGGSGQPRPQGQPSRPKPTQQQGAQRQGAATRG